MKRRICAIALLVAFIILLVVLTKNGIPTREEYEEKFGTSSVEK